MKGNIVFPEECLNVCVSTCGIAPETACGIVWHTMLKLSGDAKSSKQSVWACLPWDSGQEAELHSDGLLDCLQVCLCQSPETISQTCLAHRRQLVRHRLVRLAP